MQNTPQGKRPQDSRGPLASGQQKKYLPSLTNISRLLISFLLFPQPGLPAKEEEEARR